MSHVATSMLETYNSLVDPSLAGYFNNDRTRKFLVKQGLITKRGEVVPEPVYRERFARQSRQEYVNDMLARAIVHKALDDERRRQVTIRRKLEEIARLEHVRHVRADRDKNKSKLFERPKDAEVLQSRSKSSPSRRGLSRRKKQQPNMLGRSAEPTSTRFITDEQLQRKAANDDDDDKEYSVSYGSDQADTNRSDRSGSARKSSNSQPASERKSNNSQPASERKSNNSQPSSERKSNYSQPGSAHSGASQPGSETRGSKSSQKSQSVSGERVSANASPRNKSLHSSLRSASLESSLKQSDSEDTVKHGSKPSRASSRTRTLSRSRSTSASASSSSSSSRSSSRSVAEVKKPQKARGRKNAKSLSIRELSKTKIDTRFLVNLDQAALIEYNRLMSGYGQSNARRFAPRPPEEKRTGRKRTVVRNRRGLRSDSAYRHTQRKNKSLERSGGSSARSLSIPRMPKSTERIKSLCKITLRFHGFKKISEKERKMDDKTREFLRSVDRHTVIVEQQHCGGNTVEVFRGDLYPETEFEFVSQRHRGFPFGISIYIDGTRDCRLSQCCEAKYKPGLQFGNGHFSFVRIVGGKPCYKCRMGAEKTVDKDKKKNKKQKSERRPSTGSEDSKSTDDEVEAQDDPDAPYQDEEFDQASERSRPGSPESFDQGENSIEKVMEVEEVSNSEDDALTTQKAASEEDNESAQEEAQEEAQQDAQQDARQDAQQDGNSEGVVENDERPASENSEPQEIREPTPVKSVTPSADTEFTEDDQDNSSDVSSTSKAVEALHSSRTSVVNQEVLEKAGFERTVEAVMKNSKPENLVINAVSELGDAELEKLLDQVSESGAAQNYKRLTISGCENLTEKAGNLIGTNLKKFQRLETIEIANIELGDAGVKNLAEAIKNHFIVCYDAESEDNTYRAFTLRKVILSSCNVGDEGIEAFGALLKIDTPIDTLHLLGCEFSVSADTWSRFCGNLVSNTELQSLDISGSMLGDEKMIAVLEGLMGNRALQYLGIRSNLCDGKCTEHLLKLIETHPKLSIVDYSYGNAFASDQIELINQALSKKAADFDDN